MDKNHFEMTQNNNPMKEIGGYFGLEEYSGKEYHSESLALNSGRNALLYLLKALHVKRLHIPYFLCDSIRTLCDKYGYEWARYHIDSDLLPDLNFKLNENDYLYIVNYYGRLDNETIAALKSRHCNIILDNAHAFFQKPPPGVCAIYSCRKFFGVPDGAYLVTDVQLAEELEQDVSGERMAHILGRYEGLASDYYEIFRQSEQNFRRLPLRRMSALTRNLLRMIDYTVVKNKRSRNYALLDSLLGAYNQMDSRPVEGAYAYPFYCEDGMRMKHILALNKIYAPTLWPGVLGLDDCPLEKAYVENIIPLPVDQRYDERDMERVARIIMAHI